MTWRGTARLGLVLVLLLGALWLGARRTERRPVEQPPLLRGDPRQVTRIELEDPAGRLTAVRGASGWTDASGRPWRSDAPDDLLRALATLRPTTLDGEAAGDPAEWGFGAGASRLRVDGGLGAAALALEIGRRNPAWTARYARRDRAPEVLLVGGLLDWELEKLRASSPAP